MHDGVWHIYWFHKLEKLWNMETGHYSLRWRVLILLGKNVENLTKIFFFKSPWFCTSFFLKTSLLMFTKCKHREITSNALTSNRMSVCNFHYNKRLVRGLRNFFLPLFCFPANDSPILAAVLLINFFSLHVFETRGSFRDFMAPRGSCFQVRKPAFLITFMLRTFETPKYYCRFEIH